MMPECFVCLPDCHCVAMTSREGTIGRREIPFNIAPRFVPVPIEQCTIRIAFVAKVDRMRGKGKSNTHPTDPNDPLT